MSAIKGSIALLFIIINTILACIPLFAMGLLRWLLPQSQYRLWSRRMDWIIDYWTGSNRHLMSLLDMCEVELIIEPGTELSREHWYLVVSNHQSWTDIMLLQTRLRHLIPPIKFFTKRELIWIPALGPAMWLLGFPYVRRLSKEQREANPALKDADRREIESACEGFRLHPTSILNFAEGTRFRADKHQAQQGRFERLLNPKIGGLQLVLTGMAEELRGLLDVTIHYPGEPPSFWDFLCGRCRTVTMEVQLLDIPAPVAAELQNGQRQALAAWIESLWQAKDHRLRSSGSQLQ